MNKNRMIIFLTAALSLVLLSGCVSLVEEVTVFDDGSGTLRFEVGIRTEDYEVFQESIPEGLRLEDLFDTLSRDENVTSVTYDQYLAGGRTWDTVELAIADFTAVFGQARRIGPIQIEFIEQEGNFRFTQVIDVSNSPLTIPGINLMDLSNATYIVSLTTPQITTTNGVQPAAGVSTWSIPMEEVIQGGSTAFLRSNYVLDPYEGLFIPWEVFFPYVVMGFLALGGLSVLVVIIFNTVGRREKEPTLKF